MNHSIDCNHSIQRFSIVVLLMICFGIVASFETRQETETRAKPPSTSRVMKNPWQSLSVSSSAFRAVASKTYEQVLPCITSTWMMANQTSSRNFSFPEDAEQHYWEVWNATAPFRQQRPHSHAGYSGPWIENHFISHFSRHSLSYFGGLIPVFIQWVDNRLLDDGSDLRIRQVLKKVLRPNVLYFTVSQCAIGLAEISLDHPNLLVLSAGGFGHIAIPLIKGEIKAALPPPKSYKTEVGFYGTTYGRGNRQEMMKVFTEQTQKYQLTFRVKTSKKWIQEMANTKFNLAPRGIGRTSFRFAEIIQMGRLPVYLYDDIPWIPYEGSTLSISYYGLLGRFSEDGKINTIPQLVHLMKTMRSGTYEKKLKHVLEIRSLFTYPGVLREIEWFLQDPFGPRGGHLTCVTFPHTTGCCGR